MSFKYSVIGDNTPENRDYCEKIGMKRTCSTEGNLIMVVQGTYTCLELEGKIGNNFKDAINCIENPALFQSVTAIRKDSGIHQLYTDGIKWVESDIHDLLEIPDYLIEIGFNVENTHKATLEELKEHFKTNEAKQ